MFTGHSSSKGCSTAWDRILVNRMLQRSFQRKGWLSRNTAPAQPNRGSDLPGTGQKSFTIRSGNDWTVGARFSDNSVSIWFRFGFYLGSIWGRFGVV